MLSPKLRLAALVPVALRLVAFPESACAALFASHADLPTGKQYDYVVVGAGPGGSVVASRLSENPGTNVLLIEAGPSDDGVFGIEVPLLATGLQPNTLYDWNYTTTPQSGLDGRDVVYPRGRVLGGSSSINLMIWTRGSQDDFNRYATFSGDNGWSWDAIEPYFKKIEQVVAPTDHHDTSDEINISIHGTRGPVNITTPNAPYPIDSRVNATLGELSDQYPYNRDMNSGNPLGVGWTQSTYGNGIRSSASSSYIRPFTSRQNLDVLVNTVVTRVLKTGRDASTGLPIFSGVEIAQSKTSSVFAINATKEVILSAGAINTPQLLQLSGIGSPSPLAALGINNTVNLPAVGQHLSDHILVTNQFTIADPADDLLENIARNATFISGLLTEWETSKQGPLGNGPSNHVGWLRVPEDEQTWTAAEDGSAGPTSPHYELLFSPGFVSTLEAPPATGSFMTVISVLVSPSSSGSVTLASSSAFDSPLINPAYLNTSFDTQVLRAAIRSGANFLTAPAWDGFITGRYGSFVDVDLSSDEEVDAWARSQGTTIWHPTGTARMGRCKDQTSVVDPDLRVKGTRGLRVVDASVLPYIPAAHPQAVVYAFAERAANLIKTGRCYC
uniref:Alcohol oxidase n=1 Tax=Ganoderma boninense TaxID=34458 RepID=A0A5K1K0Y8_9APHY|nr:Alcohol oxidase [Ganoderma boninense]